MSENIVTIKQVMRWKPCEIYTEKKIRELFAGRQFLTARDIVDLAIDFSDKVWALIHMMSPRNRYLYVIELAEAALDTMKRPTATHHLIVAKAKASMSDSSAVYPGELQKMASYLHPFSSPDSIFHLLAIGEIGAGQAYGATVETVHLTVGNTSSHNLEVFYAKYAEVTEIAAKYAACAE